jgi:hypothetical protein
LSNDKKRIFVSKKIAGVRDKHAYGEEGVRFYKSIMQRWQNITARGAEFAIRTVDSSIPLQAAKRLWLAARV